MHLCFCFYFLSHRYLFSDNKLHESKLNNEQKNTHRKTCIYCFSMVELAHTHIRKTSVIMVYPILSFIVETVTPFKFLINMLACISICRMCSFMLYIGSLTQRIFCLAERAIFLLSQAVNLLVGTQHIIFAAEYWLCVMFVCPCFMHLLF